MLGMKEKLLQELMEELDNQEGMKIKPKEEVGVMAIKPEEEGEERPQMPGEEKDEDDDESIKELLKAYMSQE